MPLAQLTAGEDISLIGLLPGDAEPWRVPIGGAGAPIVAGESATPGEPVLANAADRLRAMRERAAAAGGEFVADAQAAAAAASAGTSAPAPAPHAPQAFGTSAPVSRVKAWREPLAGYGLELARGLDGDLPVIAVDTELGELAHRLGLSAGGAAR